MKNTKLVYPKKSYKIIGACIEVHKELGPGFLEKVYHEALQYELNKNNIPYTSEKELSINYKGKNLNQKYYADFVCYDEILLELKAVKEFNDIHKAQVINYLRATGMKLGLLVNFGKKSLDSKRIVL